MFDIKLAASLAELSKIEFTDDELLKITKEMDEIIALMDTVSDFEEDKNAKLSDAVGLEDIRKDSPKPSLEREDVLKNASQRDKKAFTVPKVV